LSASIARNFLEHSTLFTRQTCFSV
jgi:hypothetical protein